MILGFVASWNDSFVTHSGPTGSRSDRSYCSRDSNGNGSCDAKYLSFYRVHELAYPGTCVG
jgi:hypothetical protein